LPLDVLVIGGGQAGLAMGYHLSRLGKRFRIVDARAEAGDAWRARWDSLRLFTPAQYDNLPGLPFPAARDTYPGTDAVADYLGTYAKTFELPVQQMTAVTSLTREDEVYVARAEAETLEAEQVVVATGSFQVPLIPPIAAELDSDVHQIHSAHYRNPEAIPPGNALVVGAANSGCQIALELSATRHVELSTGEKIPTVPQRPFGKDVWWWANGLGLGRVTVESRLGKRLATRDQVIGIGPRQLARRHGVVLRPRVTQAAGHTITFADGKAADFDVIVWATGFRTGYSWVDVSGLKDRVGRIPHTRGVTRSPGLYLLGLSWQHTRRSALLGWVGRDAAYLADRIESRW
jgi:putative flavoprotein involved in K+ transport